jgi:pyruvate/2-oxoglutarate dehydrogenase complex dihydrolipoamide dehydrogenase (E3) component
LEIVWGGNDMTPAGPAGVEAAAFASRDLPGILPDDPHDQVLVRNVRPLDWVNPVPAGRYNLVAIGGGTAGLVSAAGAAGLGARVALVERHLLGGDCLNYGCVPSKALLRAARAAREVREAAAFGLSSGGAGPQDFAAVMTRMRARRAQIAPHDSARRFRDLGIDVFVGAARFVGPDTVEVDGRRLRFSRAVIATGARPAAPPIPGLAEAGFLTNETVFGLTSLPRRLVVIGAGPIGCELGQAFARFGSRVAIVSLDPRLLPREDPDAAALLEQRFAQDGIDLYLGAAITAVQRVERGKAVVFDRGRGPEAVEADEILVAVGRAPNVEALDLEAAGIAATRDGITVDDRLQTTNPRVYAAGDVCSRFKFTHAADAMARVAIQNALFFGRRRASALVIPWCTYTDPEIAHVGLYEAEARAAGFDVRTFEVDLAEVDRAVVDDDGPGFARLHVEGRRGRILGATLVAPHAGDLIGEVSLAMTAGLGAAALSGTIHPYPTRAEILRKLGDQYRRSRLTPGLRRWLERYFRWRR